MHVAAAKGYTQLLELLIKAGGDVNAKDNVSVYKRFKFVLLPKTDYLRRSKWHELLMLDAYAYKLARCLHLILHYYLILEEWTCNDYL